MAVLVDDHYKVHPTVQHRFSPYAQNGGTVVAVAGEDFSVVGCDTRLSEGYSILSRDVSKVKKMTKSGLLGCVGFHGDVLTLTKSLDARLKQYKHTHGKDMSCEAMAQMLSSTLYYRRFFPYWVYNMVAGIDNNGKGCVFSYDPVGSYERETYRASGSASAIIQPLLDNQLGYKNQSNVDPTPLSRDRARTMVRDIFAAASERDIYTGDEVEISVVDANGIETQRFPLRSD
ncbi:proteasome subunit beta type-1-B-like [Bolinopsis microptera]|uniref:proteasome subunit beta type-1-B-like n=1 Tax=Bolinopsis microptera TaxID=2820187 RepID=UPI003078B942